MIAQHYKDMLGSKSVIRQISEWSTARGAEIGYENVFDYSLGNPSVPCPPQFTAACADLLAHTDPVRLHGYTPTLTLPSARKAVAESLNRRFGMDYTADHIFMTTGAAGALAHAVRCVGVPGQNIVTFAPFFPEYKPYIEGAGLTLREGLFGMSWLALTALLACGLLFALALIDAKTQLLPDSLNLLLALCGLAGLLLRPAMWASALTGAVCVSVPMLLLCLAIPGAFGGGDIKLMAAAGLFLSWQHTLLAMFFGILGGGFYGMYLLAARKADKKDHFAFGPFLCVGIVLALLFGDPVLAWYCRFL